MALVLGACGGEAEKEELSSVTISGTIDFPFWQSGGYLLAALPDATAPGSGSEIAYSYAPGGASSTFSINVPGNVGNIYLAVVSDANMDNAPGLDEYGVCTPAIAVADVDITGIGVTGFAIPHGGCPAPPPTSVTLSGTIENSAYVSGNYHILVYPTGVGMGPGNDISKVAVPGGNLQTYAVTVAANEGSVYINVFEDQNGDGAGLGEPGACITGINVTTSNLSNLDFFQNLAVPPTNCPAP